MADHLDVALTSGLRVAIDLSFCGAAAEAHGEGGEGHPFAGGAGGAGGGAVNTPREVQSLAKQLRYRVAAGASERGWAVV